MMVAGDRTTYTRTSWHPGFDPDRVLGRLARTARAVAIAITIVSLASAVRSESQELPVGFQERCRPSTLNVSAECLGYALGIYDAMHAVQMSERLFGLRACAPSGMMDERVRELMI